MIPRVRPWANYPAVLNALSSGRGEDVSRFEEKFAQSVGGKHAVATNMGRGALQAALLALNVGPDSEVIFPAVVCEAVVESILSVGGIPVPADIDLKDFNVSAASVASEMTDRTRAVIAVHAYGFPCDVRALAETCSARGVGLIEDCAQAAGAKVENRPVGIFGDIGIFSFAFDKIVSLGSGGVAVTRDPQLGDRLRAAMPASSAIATRREKTHLLRFLKLHAMFSPRVYAISRHASLRLEDLEWQDKEVNAPLGPLRSALGRWMLDRTEWISSVHRRNARILLEGLELPGIELPAMGDNALPSPLRLTIRVPERLRDILSRHLVSRGFEVVPAAYERPVHEVPRFRGRLKVQARLSNAEAACRTLLNFPTHHYVSEESAREMCGLVKGFVKGT